MAKSQFGSQCASHNGMVYMYMFAYVIVNYDTNIAAEQTDNAEMPHDFFFRKSLFRHAKTGFRTAGVWVQEVRATLAMNMNQQCVVARVKCAK